MLEKKYNHKEVAPIIIFGLYLKISFEKFSSLKTGSMINESPRHNGINKQKTAPVENHTGTICK